MDPTSGIPEGLSVYEGYSSAGAVWQTFFTGVSNDLPRLFRNLVMVLLPIWLVGVVGARSTASIRLISTVAIVALSACLVLLDSRYVTALPFTCVAFLYLILVAAATHIAFSSAVRPSVPALVTASVLFYFLVPVWLFRNPWSGLAHVLGWQCIFKAISYFLERRDGQFRDFLFFLLVDPAYSYTDRAQPAFSPGLANWGLPRAAMGIAVVLFGYGASAYVASSVSQRTHGMLSLPALLWLGVLGFFSYYSIRSGFTSIRIGLLRVYGYKAAEGYHYPFLASGPVDFWRRWNTYLGRWFRQYVFVPSTVGLGRRLRFIPLPVVTGIAVVATFALVGIAHDAQTYATTLDVRTDGLRMFARASILLIAWFACERICTNFLKRFEWKYAKAVLAGASRIAFLLALSFFAQQWFST